MQSFIATIAQFWSEWGQTVISSSCFFTSLTFINFGVFMLIREYHFNGNFTIFSKSQIDRLTDFIYMAIELIIILVKFYDAHVCQKLEIADTIYIIDVLLLLVLTLLLSRIYDRIIARSSINDADETAEDVD